MAKHQAAKKLTVNDLASVATEEKFIKRLKEQQHDKQEAEENRKTLHKCLHKILNRRHRTHQQLNEVVQEEVRYFENISISRTLVLMKIFSLPQNSKDAYVESGIYDKFGNSCTESLKKHEQLKQEVEAEDLTSASWYHCGIIGKFSVELLRHQTPGSFIIHKASHKSGNFILSLRVPSTSDKVEHHLIVQSKQGYRFKGATKVFSTVTSLVTHHSVMSERLPVTLLLQRPSNLIKKYDKSDDFYSLEDLGTIFTDLEMWTIFLII